MQSICVFCGSREGSRKSYMRTAHELGKLIGEKRKTLIYGGASIGLMGAVADSTLEFGGKAIGVLPEVIMDLEVAHENLTELIKVSDMHERKKLMYQRADCFVVIPGGYGTLDELFEALTWTQLGIHSVPIYVLNRNGFYDHLKSHFDHMLKEGFVSAKSYALLEFIDDMDDLARKF